MTKRWLAAAGLAAAAAGPVAAGSAPSPLLLLQRAHRAAGHVSYSGRQVTAMWNESETAATVTQEYHAGDGRLRIETLMPPAARGRVVVDDGRNRWQYEPSRRVVYR